jgi:hypothetical protein
MGCGGGRGEGRGVGRGALLLVRVVVWVVVVEKFMVEVAILVEVIGNILDLLDIKVDFERVGAGDACHLELLPWPVPGDGPGAGDEGFSGGDGVGPCDVDIVGGDHDDGVLLQGELDGGGGRGGGFKRSGGGRSRRMLSSTEEGGQSYMVMALLG